MILRPQRLQAERNFINGVEFDAHTYAYDVVDRRTHDTLADGCSWQYDYNDRDEVIAGKRAWVDFSPVAGQQFEYAYDNIGNRTVAKRGGDSTGAGLRSDTLSLNNLNQITSRTLQNGLVDVVGVARGSVTVNTATDAERKGEYFWKQTPVGNANDPAATTINASATAGGPPANAGGGLAYAPKITPSDPLSYDEDGNLTCDGLWTYQWDAENRLVRVESVNQPNPPNPRTLLPESARRRIDFTYDHQGRRVSKKVYLSSGGVYSSTPATCTNFLYDGWRLLAELNGKPGMNLAPVRSYLWGADLSGTLDGAGGVGGLLMVRSHLGNKNYFTAYDGNGNIRALVDAANLNVSAVNEYGPFGELIRCSGTTDAKAVPMRFSTKYWDAETDLVYYGYRYYHVALGRWINRDPMEETGGVNLSAFNANSPISNVDPAGATTISTSDGYQMRLDAFNAGGEAHFEVHIYDKGNEVGVFTRQGFINKHGISGTLSDANIPDHIRNKVNGMAVDFERRAGRIGQKGTVNIKNGSWRGGGAHLKGGATLMLIGAILLAANGDALAAELGNTTVNYIHKKQSGADSAEIDLAAIDVALAVQDIVGDAFIMYTVLEGLLE